MFPTNVAEKIKTHFVINNFFIENRAFNEIIWAKVVVHDRPQIIKKEYSACVLHAG
jgi:hypothetical protein